MLCAGLYLEARGLRRHFLCGEPLPSESFLALAGDTIDGTGVGMDIPKPPLCMKKLYTL